MSSMRDRLIPAVDVMTAAETQRWTQLLAGHVATVKIGLRLFIAEGPGIVRRTRADGMRVFLDLKLHDIPSTVAAAASAAAELDVAMMTVHASGGPAMIRAAVDAVKDRSKIIAVTMLTSLGEEEARGVFRDTRNASERVVDLAAAAVNAGADGIVASPREVEALKKSVSLLKRGEPLLIITPGIRSAAVAGADDQSRTSTAGEAIKSGATHLVVGRPILGASDPIAAVNALIKEMEDAS